MDYMQLKKYLLFLLSTLFLFTFQNASAQNLLNSRATSYYTYIYKINADEVKTLLEGDKYEKQNALLYNKVDSFLTDSGLKYELPIGHYLYVHAKNQWVNADLKFVNSLEIDLFKNLNDLILRVRKKGNIQSVTNAKVSIRDKEIKLDSDLNSYILPKLKINDIAIVELDGETLFVSLESDPEHFKLVRLIHWNVKEYGYAKDLFIPILRMIYQTRDLVENIRYSRYYGKKNISRRRNTTGYFALNKPMYLPNDTLKWKALITTKKGRPYKKSVRFLLHSYNDYVLENATIINSASNGAYYQDYKLSDSLKLDDVYYVSLLHHKRNKVLMSTEFEYEDYQLDETEYEIELDQETYYANEPIILTLSGTDANNLNVLDGRANIKVSSDYVTRYGGDSLFVPNQLWIKDVILDPLGETRITIPYSIFPEVNMDVNVEVLFNNSNNESHTERDNFTYLGKQKHLEVKILNDSIYVNYLSEASKSFGTIKLKGSLYGRDIFSKNIEIPYQEKISPLVNGYTFSKDSFDQFMAIDEESNFTCNTHRTVNSIFINFSNPRNIPIQYAIYKKGTLLEKGVASNLDKQLKETSNVPYYVTCNFIWKGRAINDKIDLKIYNGDLTVFIDQPSTIYPGQTVDVKIKVLDTKDKPVKNVDLLVGAVNSQFNYTDIPDIPYYGKYPRNKSNSKFYFNEQIERSPNIYRLENWKKRMGVDTMLHYQFMQPQDGIMYYYDSIPEIKNGQVSPHLVRKGRLEDVFLITIDNRLVHYYKSKNNQVYSFSLPPGKHKISIRTREKEYVLNDVLIKDGFKLDIAIDIDNLPKEVEVYDRKTFLSDTEIRLLNHSLLYMKKSDDYPYYVPWYLSQNGKTIPFKFNGHYAYDNYKTKDQLTMLVPFSIGNIDYNIDNLYFGKFKFEPGYAYTLNKDGIIKEPIEPLKGKIKLPYWANHAIGQIDYPKKIAPKFESNIWQDLIDETKYSNLRSGDAVFRFEYTGDSTFTMIRLHKHDSVTKDLFFNGSTRTFKKLTAGRYDLLCVTEDGNFMVTDSIYIQSGGTNFRRLNDVSLKLVPTISELIEYGWSKKSEREEQYNLYAHQLQTTGKAAIKGKLTDAETGESLPFANVVLTQYGFTIAGSSTDFNGEYNIKRIHAGTYDIEATFVGYPSLKVTNIKINSGIQIIDLKMTGGGGIKLDDVVIVAYEIPLVGLRDKSFTTIRGEELKRMPGRGVSSAATISGGVASIRGARPNATVYYIDGLKVIGNLDLPQSAIDQTEIMLGGFPPMYGDKRGLDAELEAKLEGKDNTKYNNSKNAIRNNFNDCGYWQPNKITNANGEASFRVTFPDNITKWKTYALAVSKKRQTGKTISEIKSYKNLLGQLATPRFLIVGDNTSIVGKISNYETTNQLVHSEFKIDDKIVTSTDTTVQYGVVEHVNITAPNQDEVSIQYQINRADGYAEGEKKTVPVFPIGLMQTDGTFHALHRDTTFQVSFKEDKAVKVYLASDLLTPMLDEIDNLKDYPYSCMEQTASKLIGYLLEKDICEHLDKKFKHTAEVFRLIKKLNTSQNDDGTWGWWPKTESNLWMTAYVCKALKMASDRTYFAKSFSFGRDQLNWHIDILKGQELLFVLGALSEMNQTLPYDYYLAKIDTANQSDYQKLEIIKIKQKQGFPYDIKPLLADVKKTFMGNLYWGNSNYSWYNSNNNLTVLAYQVIAEADSLHAFLPKIRAYFLESKGKNQWHNTVERAQILKTIIPGIIKDYGVGLTPPTVTLSGSETQTITNFPFEMELPVGTKQISINKKGSGSVYFTTYTQTWNPKPEITDSSFEITTWFERDGKHIDSLIAGQPVELKVQVNAKKSGEYIMIEVPIPAGCSYGNNKYSGSYREVHREYFKHKTNIYLENINEGSYTYSIKLQPRFSGAYTLNPTKVELMYFPTFSGNNGVKKTVIK
ncbi:MAG: carboxypeptidase regulatory-like domain-containing protein [Flavobacteriales bacterium]|nr:carboxypeptidase regulatory-like domain-containing protein [Flavobacteriales bacterium]